MVPRADQLIHLSLSALAASIMKIMYDNDVESDIQDQMTWVDQSQEGIAQCLPPGRCLIDILPWLRYLPSFFHGPMLWLKSPEWRKAAMSHKEVPFARLQEEMVSSLLCAEGYSLIDLVNMQSETGEHNSVVGKLLQRVAQYADIKALYQEEEDIVKNVGAIALEGMYLNAVDIPPLKFTAKSLSIAGGADTVLYRTCGTVLSCTDLDSSKQMFSVIQTTFLAMSLYPGVLRKAQAELDAVVGPNRLPDWDDQDSLPYVSVVIKESLRWMNVFPLGIPHCTTADDEFDGYFIPAGTIVLPNTW